MSKPHRKPIDVGAFAAAALPQPDPVVAAIAAQKERESRRVDDEVVADPEAPPALGLRETRVTRKAKVHAASDIIDTKGRAGKVGLQMWVRPEKRRKLRLYAAGHDRKIDGLLAEALDDLFVKLGID